MKAKERDLLIRKLREQRERLFKEVADTEADLRFIGEDRESEIEERAQEERAARLLARLDQRGKREIEEIDAALQRLAAGTYGRCERCRRSIGPARLEALPAARLCVRCARAEETRLPPAGVEEPPRAGELPADLALLSDRDLEAELREIVRQDGRVDMDELRIVCRHGVAYLDGAVPSEAEHQIVRKRLTDLEGLQEVVDRLQVKEILWEREDRSKPERIRALGGELPPGEPSQTEDVVKSIEEGIDYVPPGEPPPEEE